jgi:hypothetical protein
MDAAARATRTWPMGWLRRSHADRGPEAARFVSVRGGQLWVRSARPKVCCAGTPSYMHAATEEPPGRSGFRRVPAAGLTEHLARNGPSAAREFDRARDLWARRTAD